MTTVLDRAGWATWTTVPGDQGPVHWHPSSYLAGVLPPYLPLCPWAASELPQRQARPPAPSQTTRTTGQAQAASRRRAGYWDHEQGWRLQDKRRRRSMMEASAAPGAAGRTRARAKSGTPDGVRARERNLWSNLHGGTCIWHLCWPVAILFI